MKKFILSLVILSSFFACQQQEKADLIVINANAYTVNTNFDKAESSFVTAYRKHHKVGQLEIHVDYIASSSIEDKTLIITDPMLATGQSMLAVYKALQQMGSPKKIHLVIAIASQEAVDFVMAKMPRNTELWVGAIDAELTAQSYIVPGLGDAGDLAYGEKK